MERDIRRDRSQWRGVHTFDNIICDGDQVGNLERSGGLKMGQSYYYYYELDGSTETHDPSMPTTNACPYLPGQTVNTLDVPSLQRLSRFRSASENSLRITDYKTMNPKDRFMAPRPAPPVPNGLDHRVGSSPAPAPIPSSAMSLVHKRSARSLSPAPSWTCAAKRFFKHKKSYGPDSDAGSEIEIESHTAEENRRFDEVRSTTPSGSIRSRDMSPESLRRFLCDDLPQTPPVVEPSPKLIIPDEIIEENEDDDDFVASAVSENAPFTMLSPPPIQRSAMSFSGKADNKISTAAVIPSYTMQDEVVSPDTLDVPLMLGDIPRSHFSISTASSLPPTASPRSAGPRDFNQLSFFDETDDDDEANIPEVLRRGSAAACSIRKKVNSPITGYSLPQPATHIEKQPPAIGSPDLVARLDSGVALSNSHLLGRPELDAGFDDFVNDMGWMASAISPKYI
ncbi:uncharacterized protein F4822DRAFT_424064 [Hypoxylon trugodes]|uniref:uncharacterized protein n=1 Tax=Hypoxylon trugodes TaxID=326681 RepID=UPI00218ED454|nr:uncharacterized protein F4822DRAFT_424064 [Hypoxylon trugodes]KAI1393594.1 hypothetical protein F4822DRAFT_424064 [Hypoxylon trugodes]